MSERSRHRLTEAEFLDWLPHQDRRHELVDGEPVIVPARPAGMIALVVYLIGRLHG